MAGSPRSSVVVAALLVGTACNPLWGVDELTYQTATSGAGATSSAGGMDAGGSGGSSGGGGGMGGTMVPAFCASHPDAIFCDDFESGTLSLWDDVDPGAEVDTLAASGDFALRASIGAGQNACVYAGARRMLSAEAGALDAITIAFDMRPSSAADGESFFAIPFRVNLGDACQILTYHDGVVQDVRVGMLDVDFSTTPPLDQWSRVAFELRRAGVQPTLMVLVDDQPVTAELPLPIECALGTDVTIAAEVHCYSETGAVELRYDNVLVEAPGP